MPRSTPRSVTGYPDEGVVRRRGLWGLRARRGSWSVAIAVVLAAVCITTPGAASAVASKSHSQAEPRMHFDRRMRVETVCFSVTNPAGSKSTLYGQRYTDGRVSFRTPAIVLVHGVASSTANWDFSPTWSVARALAAAGYVVISYDRLGYAKSPYPVAGGGQTLTTAVQRDLLHQLVGEVKSGNYTTASHHRCSGAQRRSKLHNRRVVIIGHSAGGWVVAGYPGKYHDVAAMVQADITAVVPIGTGKGGKVTPDPRNPGYFEFFHTSQNCRDFNIFPKGAVRYVVKIACKPPFLDSPLGEVTNLTTQTYPENTRLIGQIGPRTHVLLTSGDHDGIVPPANARKEFRYYKAHCGCDVSQLILRDTGHLFMAHKSLSTWVDYVVHWLRSRGIKPLS